MNKVQASHDHYEGIHAMIQSTLYTIEVDIYVHVPSLDINSLRSISLIRSDRQFTKFNISFSSEYFPTELIHITINNIQSNITTTEEQYLGHFARVNLMDAVVETGGN